MIRHTNQLTQAKYNLLSVAIATALASPAVYAAEVLEQDEVDIERVEIKGQASEGTDSLITLDDLELIQAADLSDVFRRDAEVSVGGSVGLGQKIYVRNIGEDMLNISIDEAEQAGSVFHHSGRIAIEPDLLKQVEVQVGAGNATAGPGALGGAVRFVTKDPEDLLRAGETAGALIKGTYYSNSEGYKVSTTVFGQDSSGTLSGMASFVQSEHNDAEDGNGDDIVGSESNQQLGYAKLVVSPTDAQTIKLSYENLQEDGDILYKPELVASSRNLAEPAEAERNTAILNYQFAPISNDYINLSATVYSTEQEQEREFSGIAYDGAVETVGVKLENMTQLANHQLIYGINYRNDESSLNDVDYTPSAFKETGEVKGIYIQDNVEVSNRLTLSGGARFDQYELEDVNRQTFDESGFSPNLSARYEVLSGLSVNASYAEALRGPEVKDSFKLSTSSNAANLEAEEAKNYELSVDFSRNGLNLSAGGYISDIENAINGASPWAKVYENIGDIETTGYFVKASYAWNRLNTSLSFHSADTEMGNEPVTRYVYSSNTVSKGDTVVAEISYDVNDDLIVGWAAEFVNGLHDLQINVDGEDLVVDKPGYGVHDIYARWFPTSSDDFSLTLTVKNLFDKQYLDHASVENLSANPGWERFSIVGSPEAGRDIRLTAALRI